MCQKRPKCVGRPWKPSYVTTPLFGMRGINPANLGGAWELLYKVSFYDNISITAVAGELHRRRMQNLSRMHTERHGKPLHTRIANASTGWAKNGPFFKFCMLLWCHHTLARYCLRVFQGWRRKSMKSGKFDPGSPPPKKKKTLNRQSPIFAWVIMSTRTQNFITNTITASLSQICENAYQLTRPGSSDSLNQSIN